MRKGMNALVLFVALASLTIILMVPHGEAAPPQEQNAPKTGEAAPSTNRLVVEVTGGDSNTPVENASVYVKTIHQGKLKDKKFEVNVKTNQKGLAHIPDTPIGRVEIQIVAEGWKPFGHWFDITDPQQVVKIHLDRPPKWY